MFMPFNGTVGKLPPALLLAAAAAASSTTNNHLNRSKLATENAMWRQSDNTIKCIQAVAKCSWHPKEKLRKFLNLSQFMERGRESRRKEKKGKTRLHQNEWKTFWFGKDVEGINTIDLCALPSSTSSISSLEFNACSLASLRNSNNVEKLLMIKPAFYVDECWM